MSKVNPEALDWLNSESVVDFAVNHFDYKTIGIEFIKEIYSKGAIEVLINSESIQIEDSELYADAVIVKLPNDLLTKEDILKFCQTESQPGCYVEEKGDSVYLWWD